MKINELKPALNSTKTRKRIGRGQGSTFGKTSGRGMDGQKSRSGYSRKLYSEGGQTPLVRRLPKRGFNNKTRVEYAVVNLSQIDKMEEAIITPEILIEKGLVKKGAKVKILGDGNLSSVKEISANAFSKTAIEKITKSNSKVVEL